MISLSECDAEMLNELIWVYDQKYQVHERVGEDAEHLEWLGVTPMECGGMNGSDHSYRLTKLVKLGLAEHRKGLKWGEASTQFRGSKKYRPTAAGRAAALRAQARKLEEAE